MWLISEHENMKFDVWSLAWLYNFAKEEHAKKLISEHENMKFDVWSLAWLYNFAEEEHARNG